MFDHLKSVGYDEKTAAKLTQQYTGYSLVTGQRMKTKGYGRKR